MTGSVLCGFHTIQATAGGQILATNLANITLGTLTLLADGTNSVIDLPGLKSGAGQNGYLLSFVAQNGGTVWIPQLAGGPLVGVTINPGGVMPTAQFRQLGGITLPGVAASFGNLTMLSGQTTISGIAEDFSSLTNLNGGIITVNGGAVVTMPALQNYVKDSCDGPDWTVTGPNSVLSLPGLTNMTGSVLCGFHTIQATAGGWILATNLTSITLGTLTLLADGAGSLINMSRLLLGAGQPGYALSFAAQNHGAIAIPACGVANLVSITAQSAGMINMSLVQGIFGSGCAISANGTGSVIDLSSLSGFILSGAQGSLVATNGGVILLNDEAWLLANVAISIPPGNPRCNP
jgi:hypothetical protein